MSRQAAPAARIAAGDPWYVDSQVRAQLRTRGRRRVIEDRWRTFATMIADWLPQRTRTGPLVVLDAGCGDGINLVGLRRMTSARGWPARIVGADYSPLRVTRAKAQDAGIAVHQASLYALPFRSGSVDVVLCSQVLEHVPDLPAALAEIRRVLVPRGLAILAVPNEGCAMGRLRNRVLQPSIGRTTDHVHFFTAPALLAAVGAAGFRVSMLERETFFFPVSHLNLLCTELAAGHALMAALRRLFPSQAGGLVLAAVAG